MTTLCTCDSGKAFTRCCEPYLTLRALPKTARQLMRSRYSAFKLGYWTYLVETWHPATRGDLSPAALENSDTQWLSLEILEHSQSQDKAIVEFIARYQEDGGAVQALHEHSRFERLQGRWFYLDGDILPA